MRAEPLACLDRRGWMGSRMGVMDGRRGAALRVACATLCLAASGLRFSTTATPQQPTFRSGVDLVAVDTQVIDRDGQPIGNLAAKDFQVWINGQARRVVSADLMQYPMAAPRSLLPEGAEAPVQIRSDFPEIKGRIIVIAIDELSFRTSDLPAVLQTVKRFLTTLPPEDVVGLYPYPFGPKSLNLSHFHSQVGLLLNRIPGLRDTYNSGEFDISAAEAMDVSANDTVAYRKVFDRNCTVPVDGVCQVVDTSCGRRLKSEANAYVMYLETVSAASYGGLRDLLQGLSSVSGPKTVMLLSAGLMTTDRVGGRPDMSSMMATAGKFAAAADARLYALHMDGTFQEASMAAFRTSTCGHIESTGMATEYRDAQLLAYGLERAAGEAGGEYFRITAGSGDTFFKRVLTETSAYYLLGVQPEVTDRDGKTHFIRVKTVDVKGATVRARAQVTIPRVAAGR
jgi:VWFA-related protein